MEPKELSLTLKIFGILFLPLSTFFAFYGFCGAAVLLYEGIVYTQDIIVFEKTTMYMLGASIFCFLFSISFIRLLITNKQMPNTKIYAYGVFYIPLLIMFIFPQIVSFFVHQHIDKINYIECKEQSTFQFNYTKYVFAKDLGSCTQYKR